MENEVRKLCATLARRKGGRGRRFAPELRRQISAVGRGLRNEGQSWFRIGREIGLPGETVRRVCETAPGFVAVKVVDEAGSRGLVVVGMYTPKPGPRPVTVEEVRRYVESYGFRFPVAVDDDWATLRKLWLDRVPDASFTSASLLIDRRGVVRHVQKGGLYAKDAASAEARRDYEAMRSAIERLLAEP